MIKGDVPCETILAALRNNPLFDVFEQDTIENYLCKKIVYQEMPVQDKSTENKEKKRRCENKQKTGASVGFPS